MFGLGERTEDEIITELTNDHNERGGTDVATKKPSAIVKKRVLPPVVVPAIKKRGRPRRVTTTPAEEAPAAPKKVRRRKAKGRRRSVKRAMQSTPANVVFSDAVASLEAKNASEFVGTYHGRGTPPEGINVRSVGARRGDGRVRIELADGTKATCAPEALRLIENGDEKSKGGEIGDKTETIKPVGRPSRLVIATRDLTRQVLDACRNGSGGDVVVTLSRTDALVLIDHISCEFCSALVPAKVGICDACTTIKAHIEASPFAARKILRRVKA